MAAWRVCKRSHLSKTRQITMLTKTTACYSWESGTRFLKRALEKTYSLKKGHKCLYLIVSVAIAVAIVLIKLGRQGTSP